MSVSFSYLIVWVCEGCIASYHRLGGLNDRNLFSHSSRGQKLKIKMSAGFISSSFLVLGVIFPTSSHGLPSVCVLISTCYKDTSHIGLGPMLMTSFNHTYLSNILIPNVHSGLWGVKTSAQEFGRTQFSPNPLLALLSSIRPN